MYFMFYNSEDGMQVIEFESKEQLLLEITPDRYQETRFGHPRKFAQHFRQIEDTEEYVLLIEGKVIVPKPVETVTKYEI
jgi:hypothetical protein